MALVLGFQHQHILLHPPANPAEKAHTQQRLGRRAAFQHHGFNAEHLQLTDLDPVQTHPPAARGAARSAASPALVRCRPGYTVKLSRMKTLPSALIVIRKYSIWALNLRCSTCKKTTAMAGKKSQPLIVFPLPQPVALLKRQSQAPRHQLLNQCSKRRLTVHRLNRLAM